jgi:hypothetical protein
MLNPVTTTASFGKILDLIMPFSDFTDVIFVYIDTFSYRTGASGTFFYES